MTRDELEKMLSEMETDAKNVDELCQKDGFKEYPQRRILTLITMLRDSLDCIDEKDEALLNASICFFHISVGDTSKIDRVNGDLSNAEYAKLAKHKMDEAISLKPSFLKEGT